MDPAVVSILIPFKNTDAFLTECLQSILDQTYPHWEVIAVDDHSTDNSLKTAELFALNDHRFRILKNNGKGIIPALQLAYAHSSGMFVCRMDSDDIMPPDKIGYMAASLVEKGPGYLAVGLVKYFSIRGISNGYARYEAWLNRLTRKGTNFSEIYKECPVPSPCWMVHRDDLDRCGAFSSDRYPEDYDLCFRMYRHRLLIIPCNKLLHYWRDYDHRTSRTSEHYAQNYFLDIKLHYFLEADRDPKRPLAVWGAGNKGKTIASALIGRAKDFIWLCDNPKKIGKNIYGKTLEHYTKLREYPDAQSIITVANEASQKMISKFLRDSEQQAMEDYYFFC